MRDATKRTDKVNMPGFTAADSLSKARIRHSSRALPGRLASGLVVPALARVLSYDAVDCLNDCMGVGLGASFCFRACTGR
jgi:hypothetical protein